MIASQCLPGYRLIIERKWIGLTDGFIHISWSVRPDCYNMQAFCYGTCYGCGCCTKKKPDRWVNRLKYLNEELEQQKHFDLWDDDPELRALQEKNVKANIKYITRRIGIYNRLVKKYTDEQ